MANVTPQLIRAARAALGLRLDQLAKLSGVCPLTVSNYEGGKPMLASSQAVIIRALENSGIEFINNGVRIK